MPEVQPEALPKPSSKQEVPKTSSDKLPVIAPSPMPVSNIIASKPPVTPPLDTAPKAKIGKDFLAALKEKNKTTDTNQQEQVIPLTAALVQELKAGYLEKLIASGRDLLKNQFMLTECIAKDADTFECVCSMHLQFNSINNLKQDLADFIIQKVNNPKVKVLTVLIEKEEQLGETVMSKAELFDFYATKFPLLKTLKDELQLSVKGAYTYIQPVIQEVPVVDTISVTLDDDIENINAIPIDED